MKKTLEELQRQKEEMLQFEQQLISSGIRYIAGVDEVGRGPLAGPVVAAAVILPADFSVLGIDDSKKLTEKKREKLYGEITENAVCCSIGIIDHDEIDAVNILNATKLAMKQAIEMLRIRPEHILIDAVALDDVPIPQTSIIKGDSLSLSIAAASIVAKVTRDKMMEAFAEHFPGYGFEKNKGYGTKAHYEGIDAQGICPIHRKTFLKKIVHK